MELAGRSVVIVGAARSGLAAARLLLARGSRVALVDRDEGASAAPAAQALAAAGASFRLGEHRPEQSAGADLVVLSPGVPPDVAPVRAARAAGVPVLGELELGARLARGRLVGITGTNGKSTTTTLAARMLAAAFPRVNAGGNLGRPLCDFLAEGLDTEDTIHVLELSSFQCETLERARFEGAALLNLTPDHLDRYPSLAAYEEAKLKLLDRQDERGFAVLPADDARLSRRSSRVRGRLAWFGAGALPGPGVRLEGDRAVSTIDGRAGELFGRAQLWTAAPHHLENALAASAVALSMGATARAVADGLLGFRGLPHRGEEIPVAAGPRFVNDSKATNVDSAVRAVLGEPRGAAVILGGRHKGGDLAPLREALAAQGDRAVLIGEAAEIFAAALEGAVPVERAGDMADAVAKAARLAGPSGTVLLAPACASLDMFRNFEHRGDSFRAEAQARFGVRGGGHGAAGRAACP